MKEKYCKDCKWCKKNMLIGIGWYFANCTSPMLGKHAVTGKAIKLFANDVHIRICEGGWWEKR